MTLYFSSLLLLSHKRLFTERLFIYSSYFSPTKHSRPKDSLVILVIFPLPQKTLYRKTVHFSSLLLLSHESLFTERLFSSLRYFSSHTKGFSPKDALLLFVNSPLARKILHRKTLHSSSLLLLSRERFPTERLFISLR